MEELCELACGETLGMILDQPQAEMHVAEQTTLVGRGECRPAAQLDRAAGVVNERSCQEQVGPEARMKLRCFAAQGRDADRVLEEATGIRMVLVDGGGIRGELAAPEHCADCPRQARMGDLGDEELEEAGELLRVTSHRRRQGRRIDIGRFERPHIELQAVAELLDAAEHTHRVPFSEAAVEQLDVLPYPRLDRSGGIDELECEIRGA